MTGRTGRVKTVAVTGGIGSGKSAVVSYLAEKGVPAYDSDSAAKRLYDTDRELVGKLEEGLGQCLVKPDGRLDRKKLSSVVFSSSCAMSFVESIVHPAVLEDFRTWKEGLCWADWGAYCGTSPFVVIESAVITEKPLFDGSYDLAVLVDAPLRLRVSRVCARDASTEAEVERRIAAQSFDLRKIDAVIDNDSTMELMRERTDIAFKLLSLQSGL